jgi:murein DD-endopeptidase MepM/ murein hydrolase activator NlpD
MPRVFRAAGNQRRRVRRLALLLVGLAYCVGVTWLAVRIAWYSQARQATIDVRREPDTPIATSGSAPSSPAVLSVPPGISVGTVIELRGRNLLLPVVNVEPADLHQSFEEDRRGHKHEAVDILAPRGTPVLAVEDGRIARLFYSQAGGHTVYHFDPTERYSYYYAHLERYAEGLDEGQSVRRGQVIGYVGTSGNAPENTPHLHFAIFALGSEKRWWEGTAIDPFLVWR